MKFGTFSVILNKDEYSYYGFNNESNDLLKITDNTSTHKREIDNISEFKEDNEYIFQITSDIIDIKETIFIDFLKKELEKNDAENINMMFLKNNKILGYFVENLGSFDLYESICDLLLYKGNIWFPNTEHKIKKFTEHMCLALEYLKKKQIGHFDIKPENIIYNDINPNLKFEKRFKLIDFGFSDKFPFQNYRNCLCGSAFYIPKKIIITNFNQHVPEWAPNLDCNDWKFNSIINRYFHYSDYISGKQYELIYKTDVYSMGITFNQLLYHIKNYYFEKKIPMNNNYDELEHLIKCMTLGNVVKRYAIEDCLKHDYFKIENKSLIQKIFSTCNFI